mgnify:CR=1 FL=1
MSKLINVADDVYEKLSRLKSKNESFSELLRQLLIKKSNKEAIMELAGAGEFDDKKLAELKGGWKKWSEKYA